ncbi:MAG TPA: ribosome recycling factor [Candidatus Saccharimonadales bacterium]|jgi:ribosome recycling factor|nr:ribosome recycling factor [Candidatus Saccharimonadales bacterium]
MNPNQIVDGAKQKLQAAVDHFQDELKKVRTGRAHPSMLDGVVVMAYGTPMPLNQVSTVTTPEAQLLQITPFDPGNLQAIASAIRDNPSLGLNPSDDGRVVRVPIPPLTEERRREYVKMLGGKVEDCMVVLRNVRHDALKQGDQAKKDKAMSEDDYKRLEKQIDDLMASQKLAVDQLAKAKEAEIMTV